MASWSFFDGLSGCGGDGRAGRHTVCSIVITLVTPEILSWVVMKAKVFSVAMFTIPGILDLMGRMVGVFRVELLEMSNNSSTGECKIQTIRPVYDCRSAEREGHLRCDEV